MSIIASQLIGLVTIQGADESIAKVLGVGASFDAVSGGPLARLKNGFGNLAFGFRNLGTEGTIGMDAIKQGAAQVGPVLLVMGAVAAVALGALIAKTTDMAGNFQQGVNRLRTGAGDVQDSFNTLGNGIKQVAVATGTATTPLIAAMYQILSANQRGAQSFLTLTAAAQGAKIEQANLVDVTKALTTLQTNWGISTYTAAQYMNGLIVAVASGKISLEELTSYMGPILPIAKQMGISFMDVAAAMSVQTNAGLKAAQSATGLQAVFVNIENPTAKASKAMIQFGVDSVAVANEMKKSLPGAFQMLMDAALKVGPIGSVAFNRAMADMVGGGTRTAKTIDALSQHMKDWTSEIARISVAMKSGAVDVNGWALVQGNFNLQMDKAKASLEVLGITIGQALLPVLTKIVAAIAPIIVAFTNWLVSSGAIMPILGGLAALIAGTLVAALVALVIAFWPVFAIGAAVGLLVAGIILAVQHWGQIMQWIGGIFSWLGTQVHNILGDIGSFVGNIFNQIGTKIRDGMTTVKNAVGGAFDWVGTKVHDALTGVKNTTGNAFDWVGTKVRDGMTTVKNAVGGAFDWLYNHNYYWKAIVDAWPVAMKIAGDGIKTVLTDIKNAVGGAFSAIGTFIHDRLVWIDNSVGWFFSQVGSKFQGGLTWINNSVGWFFSQVGSKFQGGLTWTKNLVGGWFSDLGGLFSSKLSGLVGVTGQKFGDLGSAIHDKITGAWNWVVSFVSGWPAQAFQWGLNFISGLINGIGARIGDFFSMIGGIGQKIASVLGFHSPPKEGPAHDADKWMPNMMAMFASGIAAGTPTLRRALTGALVPVSTSLNVGSTLSSSSLLPGGISVPMSGGYSGSAASGGVQQVNLYLDSYRVGSILMPSIVKNIRNNVGVWGR